MLICSASALLFFPSSYLLYSLYAHLRRSNSHQKSTHATIFVAFGSEIDGSLQSGSEYCDPWLGSSVSHCQTSKNHSTTHYDQIMLPALTDLLFPKKCWHIVPVPRVWWLIPLNCSWLALPFDKTTSGHAYAH